jgi:hypothetical protein
MRRIALRSEPRCGRSPPADVDTPVAYGGDNAAVDEEIGAGDEGRVRAGQEFGRGGDVCCCALPARADAEIIACGA